MSRKLSLLTIAALSVVFVAFGACGGGDEKTTETPAKPTATSAAQTPTRPTGTAPTQAAAGTPTGPSFSGSAVATVVVGDQALAFKDGRCDKGADDAWLVVNIGQLGADNYFGLVVGATPAAPEGTRSAKGGGEFTAGAVGAIIAVQGGNTFSMNGVAGAKVTVDPDLKGGEFVGTTLTGQPMSGSFKC